MNTDMPESPGTPPSWVLHPQAQEDDAAKSGPVVTARFFVAADPRTDPVGNQVVDASGKIPEIEMVEIINRNDAKNTPMIVISTDIHRYRMFPAEYQAFRQGLDLQSTGIPIKEWLGDNDRTRNLAYFHIHTVEQLAAISDSLVQTLGPGTYDLRKRAIAYLTIRKDSDFAERVASENEVLKRQMDEMQANMKRLMTIVSANQARGAPEALEEHPAEQIYSEPRRRGRPASPKAQMREALASVADIELTEGEQA